MLTEKQILELKREFILDDNLPAEFVNEMMDKLTAPYNRVSSKSWTPDDYRDIVYHAWDAERDTYE